MGKLLVVLGASLAFPAVAAAQDFGTQWLDRVTHERQADRGPLKPVPVEWEAQTGVLAYDDNNVFLAPKDQKHPGDIVIVPFARGLMNYAEQRFEADADLMVDYKGYLHRRNENFGQARDWEERFWGHARYVDARWSIEVMELLQHDSDPSDAVNLTRIKRTISDTGGKATYDLTRTVSAEVHTDYEAVRFNDPGFKFDDNDNYIVDAALVYRQANGYDWLIQVGWKDIFYLHSQLSGAPPDADGYYVHGGFRGEPLQGLSVETLVGWIGMSSSRFLGTPNHSEEHTADFTLNIRYDVTEQIRIFGDVGRTLGYAANLDGSPFETITRFAGIGEYEPIEDFKIRARIQVDHAVTAFGEITEYRSYSLTGTYWFDRHVAVDAGGTYRTGDAHGKVASSFHFTDAIGHAGVVISY